MKLNEYQPSQPPFDTTLVLINRNADEILACYKIPSEVKERHGAGFWLLGPGGKVEKNEKIRAGALREIKEEIGLEIQDEDLNLLGIITFYFPYAENPEKKNQKVHIFSVDYKSEFGEPKESDEIKPEWRRKDAFNFEEMWPDNKIWAPYIFENKKIVATFLLGKEKEVEDVDLIEVDILPEID